MLRRIVPLAAILCLWLCAAGSGAEIRGVIKPTGPGLHVELYRRPPKSRSSDLSREPKLDVRTGKLVCTDVPPGTWFLDIYPDGMRYCATQFEFKVGTKKRYDLGAMKLDPSAWAVGSIEPAQDAWLEVQTAAEASGNPDAEGNCTSEQWFKGGRFEIDNLEPGDYVITIHPKDIRGQQSAKLHVAGPRGYTLPPFKFAVAGEIRGVIRLAGKRKPGLGPATRTEMYARNTGEKRSDSRDYPYGSGFADKTLTPLAPGEIAITGVPPGRYDLLIWGPSSLIVGDSRLPSEADTTESDKNAVRDVVMKLGAAFIKRDLKTIRDLSIPKSATSPGVDISKIAKEFSDDYRIYRNRRFDIIRTGKDVAIAYTRLESATKQHQGYDEELPPDIFMDVVEIWVLARVGQGWKLKSYEGSLDLSTFLFYGGAADLPANTQTVPDRLPEINYVITDDPRLTNVEVKPGEVSSGHDWTITLPE